MRGFSYSLCHGFARDCRPTASDADGNAVGNERRPDHPDSPLSRRDAVVRGLLGMAALGGAGSFLSACASSGSSSASLPSVRWPSTGDTSPRVASGSTR
ncbi:MAG: hypothetical protein ACTS27_12660, partial [Phycisphaerales bacterium]